MNLQATKRYLRNLSLLAKDASVIKYIKDGDYHHLLYI